MCVAIMKKFTEAMVISATPARCFSSLSKEKLCRSCKLLWCEKIFWGRTSCPDVLKFLFCSSGENSVMTLLSENLHSRGTIMIWALWEEHLVPSGSRGFCSTGGAPIGWMPWDKEIGFNDLRVRVTLASAGRVSRIKYVNQSFLLWIMMSLVTDF